MANSSPAKKVLLILMPLLLLAVPVLSAPNTMNIQGKLTNPSGSVLTGTFNFTFRVYDNYTSGNKLYDTNMTLATDSRGVYDIILRDVNITFADQLYLGVKVNNDAEMEPRVNLTSNPSAFRANISDDLNRNNAYTVSGVNVTGNLSLGQRLTFGLGQFFDNLANGWLKLTGALNVTSGASIGGGLNISEDLRVNNQLNITSAGNLVTAGSITSAGTIQGVTLTDGNVTITGGVVSASQVNVGGGFNAGGMTLLGADIITQGDILFSGNISVLNVTHLSVNGSILPALDSTFDIGNSSFRWRDSNFTGRIEANALTVNGSTLYVDSVNGRVGIGTASPENLFQIVSPNSNFTYLSSGGSLVAKGNAVNQPQLSLENSDADAIDLRVFQRTNTGPNIFGQSRNGLQYLTFNPNGVAVVGTGNARDLLLATNDAVRVNISSGGNVLIPSGNVGIGTTSPNDILEVIGNVRVSGSLNASSINATNMYAVSFPLGWTNLTDYPSACAPGQFMTAVGDTLGCASPAETSSAAGGWANTSTVTATALSVVIDSGTLYANATTNNVGIGTTSPSAKLHVVNPNTASNLFAFNITQQDTDAQIGEFTVNGVTTHSFSWSGTNAGNIQLSNGGVSTVFIGTNQASYFNGGNVGINTTSPAQTLTVQGTLNVSGNATGPGALFVTSSGNVGIGTTSPGAKLDVEVGTTPNGIRLLHSSGTVVAKWNVTAPGVNNDIVFGAVSNNRHNKPRQKA
ncbi:hypothetical protein HYT53_05930 [Candidatus Woesearchaeota archaeon]|nr:hypothetical protein [Candidatus Woesearchaeota archaeon]